MGEAILEGIRLCQGRKDEYKAAGISYYRPWIWLITDGAPTDDVSAAKEAIAKGEKQGEFSFWAVGVEGADMDLLNELSVARPVPKLTGLSFRELFAWLSSSLKVVSRSHPGDDIPLPAPTGWATFS